jgi:protein-S-isoprenylcysteine O-methyltransferase Ste14
MRPEKKMASIFEEGKKTASVPIPNQKPSTAYTAYEASRKQNAMWKAWERRNRISKAVRIVIANILAVPSYVLFHRTGLDWASWTVTTVVMVYSIIILVSTGTPAAWRAHWKSGNNQWASASANVTGGEIP